MYEKDAPATGSRSPSTTNEQLPRRRSANTQLRTYLEAVGAFRELPEATQQILVDIYFTQIQPITPILDADSFQKAFRAGKASRLLVNAVCLVSCKAEAAAQSLRLSHDGPLLPPKQFATSLYDGLVAANYAGLEADRVSKVRILALMSMHCEGIDGLEEAASHLTQAIHCATTYALHINFAGRKESNDTLAALFWSLWAMDKINTSECGRPLTIADRDIGIGRSDKPAGAKRRPFDIYYDLSKLLCKVMEFYRPTTPSGITGWEEDYPSFEALVGEDLEDGIGESTFGKHICPCGGNHLLKNLAILELYYQAITIVACRADDTATASYARQALAALRIQTLMTVEHATDLAPLPVVPYAVSLALSVAYRQWRKAEIPSRIRTAMSNLRICTEILERLSETWYSASPMASLGRKVLQRSGQGKTSASVEHGRKRKTSFFPDKHQTDVSALQASGNSLDILSSVAEAHSKAHPGSGRDNIEADDRQTLPGLQSTASSATPGNDITNLLSDNLFDDFDALFHGYMDVGLPIHYQDVDLFGNNEEFENFGFV